MTIPFLEAAHLKATMEELDLASQRFPLFRYFRRSMNAEGSIRIRGKAYQAKTGGYVGPDAAPLPAAETAVTEMLVKPLWSKQKRSISNEDLINMRDSWAEAQVMSDAAAAPVLARAQRRLNEYVNDVSMPVMEDMHAMFVRALLGTGTYTVGGVAKTISYGLTALTQPGTSWATTASATPVADIHAALEEFHENCGKPATHVFYSPKMINTYLLPNTDWTGYVKASPEVTNALLGLPSASEMFDPQTGEISVRLFGLTWVPVPGSALVSGSSTQRWATDKLTFAHLPAGIDVLTHEMSADMMNGGVADRVLRSTLPDPARDEVGVAKLICEGNGAAAIHHRNYVQTWDVTT